MRRLSITVLSVAVLATLFASVQTLVSSTLASAAVAPTTNPQTDPATLDLSKNQFIDTSTIRYGNDWYFDDKIDDTFEFKSLTAKCDGQDKYTNYIAMYKNDVSSKNYASAVLHTFEPAQFTTNQCTEKKQNITLLYTDRFVMPFEFVDDKTIVTADKGLTFVKDDKSGLFLESNSQDGCVDYIKVDQPDNGTFANISVTTNFKDGFRAWSHNYFSNWWYPVDDFATTSKNSIPHTNCATRGPVKFKAATLLKNNPDTSGADTAPNVGGAGLTPSDQLSLDCQSGWNPLNWLICGVIDGMVKAVSWVDSLINSMLSIGTDGTGTDPVKIFDNVQDPASPSHGYYQAWKGFRTIAIGLIFVAGLIIIIAQETGSELVDAYTVKKTLPRLVIALVGVALSWQLMRFFVGFTNALGYGVRALIYEPFTQGTNGHLNNAVLQGGGDAAVSLMAGIAGAALGIFGLLSFVLTAALAVFVAFIVLVLRQLVVLILILTAPIAIVAYVLPNTKKIYDLWWDSLSKALLMFPIISALVAIGRVFSYVSNSAANTNSGSVSSGVQHIIGYIAYFAPYFLIPYTLKFAGGALGRLGGMVNDKSRGGFNRLSGFRANQQKKRLTNAKHRAQTRNVFRNSPEGSLRSRLNSGIQTASMLNQAGYRPSRMKSNLAGARSASELAHMAEAMEKDTFFNAIKNNDDLLNAGMEGRGTEADARKYLQDRGQTGATLETNLGLIRKAKESMGMESFMAAAAVANAGTGTGYAGGAGEMIAAVNKASGGNAAISGNLLAMAKSRAEQARRFDLSGASFGSMLEELGNIRNARTPQEFQRAVSEANVNLADRALDALGPGAILNGRGGSVENFIPAIQRRIQRAQDGVYAAAHPVDANGKAIPADRAAVEAAQRNLQQTLASTAGLYDAAAGAAPESARRLADGIMAAPVTDSQGRASTVLEMIDRNRNDLEFQQMRRELGSSTRQQYEAEMARMGTLGGDPSVSPLQPGNDPTQPRL